MCNHIHLQEKILEEHCDTMQREMARQRLLVRRPVPRPALGRRIVGTLGTRLVAIGMRLEQAAV